MTAEQGAAKLAEMLRPASAPAAKPQGRGGEYQEPKSKPSQSYAQSNVTTSADEGRRRLAAMTGKTLAPLAPPPSRDRSQMTIAEQVNADRAARAAGQPTFDEIEAAKNEELYARMRAADEAGRAARYADRSSESQQNAQQPPAPRPQASPSDVARAIKILNDPHNEKGIFAKDPTVQAAAVADLKTLLAMEASAEERATILNSTKAELRGRLGLDSTERTQLISSLKPSWDTDGSERGYLAEFAAAGYSGETVGAVMDFYTKVFNSALGDVANLDIAAVEADFVVLANKIGLTPEVTQALIYSEKVRLGLVS
jgi:hypothetical protein